MYSDDTTETKRRTPKRGILEKRILRKIKAGASVVLALGAGAFLACAHGLTACKSESLPPDPDAAVRDAGSPEMAGTDAAQPDRSTLDLKVDLKEHRDGMPVPDNLLE